MGRTFISLRNIVKSENGVVSHHYHVGHERGKQLKLYLDWILPRHQIKDIQLYESEPFGHLFVVSGPEKGVDFVRALIERMDRPEPQIQIEAVIAEVEVASGFQSGFESAWDRKGSERTFFRGYDLDFNPDDFLNASTGRPFQGGSGTFSTKGSPATQARFGDLDIILRAVAAQGRVEVLQKPRVLVVNGEQATLTSGFKILVPTNVQINAGGLPNTSLTFQPVTSELKIRPHLLGEHTVELHVEITAEEIVREDPADKIKTSIRKLITDAIVSEGEYLDLGGLYRKRTSVEERGLPLLSDIPILGYLFKSYQQQTSTTELRILIRPTIVRAEEPESAPRLIVPDTSGR